MRGFKTGDIITGYKDRKRSRFEGEFSLGHTEVKTFIKH